MSRAIKIHDRTTYYVSLSPNRRRSRRGWRLEQNIERWGSFFGIGVMVGGLGVGDGDEREEAEGGEVRGMFTLEVGPALST